MGCKNNISARHFDSIHPIGQNLAWTYYLTLQPKQVYVRISHSSQNTRWPTNPISARHLDLVHQITTKLNMDILLDPTNNFAQEFII
jgi:hypothetical protein